MSLDGEPAAALGDAVMPEFADAVGLGELRDTARGPGRRPVQEPTAPAASEAQPPVPELPLPILCQTLVQADQAVSEYIGIDPEDAAFMEGLAGSMHPLINYYAAKANPVVAMWAVAIVGLAGYVGVKWKKGAAASAAEPLRRVE